MGQTLAYLCCLALCVGSFLHGSGPVYAQPAPGTADFDPRNPPTQTLVMRGETLFNIAERTRSPLQALIRTNDLRPPFTISPGQILVLPPLKVHIVASGENFTTIAKRYSVDERSLAIFNRLARPVQVRSGQRIILPPFVVDRFTGLEPQDLLDLLSNEIEAGREVTGAIPGQIVRNSEASSPQVRPPALPPQPPLVRPAGPSADGSGDVTSQFDTQVTRYGPTEDDHGVAVRPPTRAKSPTPQSPTQSASLLPRPSAPQRPRIPSSFPSVTDMPPSTIVGSFMWPVTGKLVETFGAKSDFRTLDGIEIEAPAGAPFKAAANGTVVYVGNQLPGYGWLVLIRHADNMMSAYAYAQSVNVRENQVITRGQIIGLVGTTGRAATPRLHFQLRQNTRPVDPLPRLPKLRAAA